MKRNTNYIAQIKIKANIIVLVKKKLANTVWWSAIFSPNKYFLLTNFLASICFGVFFIGATIRTRQEIQFFPYALLFY